MQFDELPRGHRILCLAMAISFMILVGLIEASDRIKKALESSLDAP
jgi:hypothetical protein